VIAAALWTSIALPPVAALILTFWPVEREPTVARLALGATGLSALASLVAIAAWVAQGAHALETTPYGAFAHDGYRFALGLELDGAAAIFLILVQFITGMVVRFSRFYLHREPGFRRFFATVLWFQGAMCLLALAGNLDLMFAAWELVGISSFLLIGFYRERRSAVRNALKTYSVYRVADIGMLLAACLQGSGERSGHLIGLLLLLAAMGKSAQVPFSFWVPRAMEGPTPSSALFYGALSVHAGAYLLLRNMALFGGVPMVRVCIGLVGLVTAVLCSMFSRVQPTIKGQIGYASVTQVGIIFVELALGLPRLALLHIVSNALLRCYQLLVSPSVVAHRLRQQASAGAARAGTTRSFYERLVPEGWWPTLYTFALSEGYLKDVLKVALWFPVRRIGASLQRRRRLLLVAGAIGVSAGLVVGPRPAASAVAAALILLAVSFSCCGLATWRRPVRALGWITGSNLLAVAATTLSNGHARLAAVFYGFGIVFSCLLGVSGLVAAGLASGIADRFSGRWEARPRAAVVAFAGALGIAGVPLFPTFWGEDLIVHSTLDSSRWFSFLVAAIVAANGYLAVRNFAYSFFGSVRASASNHDHGEDHQGEHGGLAYADDVRARAQ
jgi:NADH:ubiquinone oxidoreductase subunit 5 (subunit L)/multisubunit Na+/H+ antiporter MnhA subunit